MSFLNFTSCVGKGDTSCGIGVRLQNGLWSSLPARVERRGLIDLRFESTGIEEPATQSRQVREGSLQQRCGDSVGRTSLGSVIPDLRGEEIQAVFPEAIRWALTIWGADSLSA